MKRQLIGTVVAAITMLAGVLHAELPRVMNFQSIVYDQDGNVTTQEFVDVNISIVDETGNIYFTENHIGVPVVNGAINIAYGEESGGIPIEALDPATGRKFVDVRVDDTNPFDILPIGAAPYSIWSQRAISVADNSIGAEQIKDGSIELRHLASQLKFGEIGGTVEEAQIPATIARKDSIDSHLSSNQAHSAAAVTIDPRGAFAAQLGNTVQAALDTIYGNVAQEISNRQTSIQNVSNQFNASTNNLQQQITTNSGNITALSNRATNSENAITNLSNRVTNNDNLIGQHNDRLSAIEGRPVAQSEKAFSWGRYRPADVYSGYNVQSALRQWVPNGEVGDARDDFYQIRFASPATNDNVIVSLTMMVEPRAFGDNMVAGVLGGAIMASNVDRNGFQVRCAYIPNRDPEASEEEETVLCPGFMWVAYAGD